MANVSSTTNKSLYRKIDENGNYSCVIDLENGTNTNLTTENKTIVGAINEINNKTTFIPVISVNKEISEDFIFDISALETIFNSTIKGNTKNFIVDFNNGALLNKRISTKITFNLKSEYDNNIKLNHTYLFDGYYANDSAIYKVYLIFALSGLFVSTNFTQKAIKIEEYASF